MRDTLRGIPVLGDRPVYRSSTLAVMRVREPEAYAALTSDVHWPFPEQAGPALCGMPLLVGVVFAGLTDPGAVTCPDCIAWMRS